MKKICDIDKINYREIEGKKILYEIFPLKIDSDIIQLRTHIVNEGNLREDSATYHNYDPILLKNFQDCIKNIGRKAYLPKVSCRDIYILTDTLTARLINFTKVGFGRTSKDNPSLTKLEKTNLSLFKKHMQITFAEEGIFYLGLHRKYKNFYADYYIGLVRAIEVTNDIPYSYKKKLERGHLGLAKLDLNLQSILVRKRCKLLDDEISTLYKFYKLLPFEYLLS